MVSETVSCRFQRQIYEARNCGKPLTVLSIEDRDVDTLAEEMANLKLFPSPNHLAEVAASIRQGGARFCGVPVRVA